MPIRNQDPPVRCAVALVTSLVLCGLSSAQHVGPLPPSLDLTLGGAAASAQTGGGGLPQGANSGFDSFNRPDGPLGSDWSVGSGNFEIRGQEFANVGVSNGWARYDGATSLYDQTVIEFDLRPNPPSLSYNAAVIGAGGTDMTFTKVQGSGSYTHIGFYRGVNGGAVSGYGGFFSITSVSGGRVRVSVSDNGDTMNVDIDEHHDGIFEYHYESSGLVSSGVAAQLGEEVGLAVYSSSSRADDDAPWGSPGQSALGAHTVLLRGQRGGGLQFHPSTLPDRPDPIPAGIGAEAGPEYAAQQSGGPGGRMSPQRFFFQATR